MRVKYRKDFNFGIREAWRKEHENSIRYLTEPEDPHEAIHEARKSFKKIRGLLRLVRFEISTYKRHNIFYRDLARQISEIRDATAFIETVQALKEQYSDQLYKNTFDDLLKELQDNRQKMLEEKPEVLSNVRNDLIAHREEIEAVQFDIQNFEGLAKGIEKTYKRGRKQYKTCCDNKTTETLHELRKRVKYIRYHIQLMEYVRPKFMKIVEDEFSVLSDLLGMDHDLNNLKEHVHTERSDYASNEDHLLLISLIGEHRKQMQEHAMRESLKLFSLKKKNFSSLFNAGWLSYYQESSDSLKSLKNLKYR